MIYLAIINIVTLIVYGVDKLKAKRHQWRIPESTLILLAVIGGSIGALLGMKIWHHKTKHKKFKYGIPIILALQLALAVYIMYSDLLPNHSFLDEKWLLGNSTSCITLPQP